MKGSEACPHCWSHCADLEEHLRREHPFKCARCGVRFGTKVQWTQHMRDLHRLDGDAAAQDDRHKRLEKWLSKDKADAPKKAPPDAGASPAPGPELCGQRCEECGAEVMCPFDFGAQGLTFRCALVGRPCSA